MRGSRFDYIIIGGGFFGSYLALILKSRHPQCSLVILEQEKELMTRASYNNQARIHNGYHYPRCLLTALRSKANFRRFVQEFKDCVYDEFKQYYAVGKIQSKINANQYKIFCTRIGIPLKPAPKEIKKLCNKDLIEEIFLVEEYAFDAIKLKEMITMKLEESKIPVWKSVSAQSIKQNNGNGLQVKVAKEEEEEETLTGKYVFVCAYSNINIILKKSEIEKIHLKQEMTEMVLVDVPDIFKNKGITVMCGPFFSFMPFPPLQKHTLSHVRYTPHHYWYDLDKNIDNQRYYEVAKERLKSNFIKMVKDASRYVPAINEFTYADSIWEIKTILPESENDDGRPILFKRDTGSIKNLICIMGGKIDNVYDIAEELEGL